MTTTSEVPQITGAPKFLVSRNAWRGGRTYHVCPACGTDAGVIGIDKSKRPDCPRCRRANIDDIFTAIDRRLRTVPAFLESVRVHDGPYGRYRNTVDDARPYRVLSSDHAMSLGHQFVWSGYDPIWTREQLSNWIDTILLDLNLESGLIEDPFEIADKGRSEQVLFEQYGASRALASDFRRCGFPDRYRLPERVVEQRDILQTRQMALDFIEDRRQPATHLSGCTWEATPYSKGAQVVWALRMHRQHLKDQGLPDDGIAEFVHDWLVAHQNPESGYWGGQRASLNNAACGVFKLLVAYNDFGWPIPRPERIIDTTLALADAGGGFGLEGGDVGNPSFGCTQFDPLMLLKHSMDAVPGYREDEIYGTVARSYLNFARHWSDEDHFFRAPGSPRATLISMHGMGTVMYMAEILLGVEILRTDR